MPRGCAVRNCGSVTKEFKAMLNEEGLPATTLFRIPQGSLEEYRELIGRPDLTHEDRVCSEHFDPDDISYFHPDLVVNGQVIPGAKRRTAVLEPGAKPIFFKGFPPPEGRERLAPDGGSEPPSQEQSRQTQARDYESEMPVSADAAAIRVSSTCPGAIDISLMRESIQRKLLPSETEGDEQPNVGRGSGTPREEPNEEPIPEDEHVLAVDETQCLNAHEVKLPRKDWALHELSNKENLFARIGPNRRITHAIIVKPSGEVEVEIAGVKQPDLKRSSATTHEVSELIQKVNFLKVCEGTECGGRSSACEGTTSTAALRCKPCKDAVKVLKRQKKNLKKIKHKMVKKRNEAYRLKKSRSSLKNKLRELRQEVQRIQRRCASLKKDSISQKITNLPIEQQKVVLTLLDCSKRKGPAGFRYEVEWVYLCIFMRIKSPALYNHLRLGKILPLPSQATLERYMKNLHPVYGYQETLFEVLADKVADLPEAQRHGAFLVDEVKLAPGISFDKHTLETMGFVDLGKETPESLTNEMGDHALVVMFQPFQGNYTQTLGCFLTKGNVKSELQARLVLEGITLTENAGLFVDAVVWDGATWNRQTWEYFGIGAESSSCSHPNGNDRRLWFFSDWNHLLKCMRNALCPQEKPPGPGPSAEKPSSSASSQKTACTRQKPHPDDKTLVTPDGLVKRMHWVALLNEEEKRRQTASQLLVCPKLSKNHVYPNGFQRMNVKMAYQFFSNSTATGMEWYRHKHVEDLQDSEPTEVFVRRINKLADAMNSNTAKGALWEDADEEKVIQEFEGYHKQCIKLANENGRDAFWTRQTDLGLLVTLRSTLELAKFLRDELSYKFVMTARFNQDALEQFFGNIRRAAGPNNHPDPKLFAQLYRLLSLYSLVKPPKGSNITGVNNLKTLMSAADPVGEGISNRRREFDCLIDEILTYGEALDSMPLSCDVDHSYGTDNVTVDEPITRFLAGFTAFRKKALVKDCDACFGTLEKPRSDATSGDRLIAMKEMYRLTFPSDELVQFVKDMELAVCKCLEFHGVHKDMAFTALTYMRTDASVQIGCLDHSSEIKKKIMKYYLTMRMYFAAERRNEEFERAKQKKKALSKQSRLQ